MTSKLEKVSALADNQWDDEAIEALLSDPELQAGWTRFHQQKDALQGDDVTLVSADFASRISQAIEQEPTVLAPVANRERTVKVPGKVVRMFRNASQYAIAATVAAVAIVGVQQYGQESVDDAPLPVLNTNPVAGASTTPVSLSAPSAQRSPAMMSQTEARERLIEQKRRINAYFQDHELQKRIQQTDPLLLEQEMEREEEAPTAP